MWQRFTPYDLRVIGHYLGTLLLFFAALMALPLATALVFQEWEPAARYLAAIGITMVAGCSLRFLRIEPGRLDRRQALAVANDLIRVYSMLDIKLNRCLLDNIMLLGLHHAVEPLEAGVERENWEIP